MDDVLAFLAGQAPRPNPGPPGDWQLWRRAPADGPRGRWRPAGGPVTSRVDAEAELTAPSGLLAPGDLARVTGPGEAHHWVVGADGLGRRLPVLETRLDAWCDRGLVTRWAAPYGSDWAEAWSRAARGGHVAALADAAGVDRRRVVSAAAAVVRPEVERAWGTAEFAAAFAALDAWARRGAAPANFEEIALDALLSSMTTRTPNDPERREAASAVYRLCIGAGAEPTALPSSRATAAASALDAASDTARVRAQLAQSGPRAEERALKVRTAVEADQARRLRELLPLAAVAEALGEGAGAP